MTPNAKASIESIPIFGFDNPEDIVLIPGTEWIVSAGYAHGALRRPRSFFVNVRTHEVRPAFPGNCAFDLDRDRFGDIAPPEVISFHGLDVALDDDGRAILYQVNHPVVSEAGVAEGRESVEIFEIHMTPAGPTLRWRGAVTSPSWVTGNDVCALPGGGFALTNTAYRGVDAMPLLRAGHISGHVLEWRSRDEGWRVAEGTNLNAPNGVAASPDGQFLFVASWATGQLHRISRSDPHAATRTRAAKKRSLMAAAAARGRWRACGRPAESPGTGSRPAGRSSTG